MGQKWPIFDPFLEPLFSPSEPLWSKWAGGLKYYSDSAYKSREMASIGQDGQYREKGLKKGVKKGVKNGPKMTHF